MDGMVISILSKILKIEPNFTEEERYKLIKYYKNGNLNQYYDIVIQKVLDDKNILENRLNITLGLLNMTVNVNKQLNIDKENDENIVDNSSTFYKTLMLVDVTGIENIEF